MDVPKNNMQRYFSDENDKLKRIFSIEIIKKLEEAAFNYLSRQKIADSYSNVLEESYNSSKKEAIWHFYLLSKGNFNCTYNNSVPYEGLSKIADGKYYYGNAINSFLIDFFRNISSMNTSQLRRYLINGDSNIMREIARLLMLVSVNDFGNIPAFIILDSIRFGGLSDDSSLSNLINSFINNNFEFEREFDSYLGNGQCQFLFSQIDELSSKFSTELVIDKDLLEGIINSIKMYYSRKIALADIVLENKKLFLNIFNSNIKKYGSCDKVFTKY